MFWRIEKAALATIVLVAATHAFAQVDDYASLRQAGIEKYLDGHYQEAESFLHKAISAAHRTGNTYGAAISYSALGDLYQARKQFADAIEAYEKGLSMIGREKQQSHDATIMWKNLGSALSAQAQYPEAIKALKKAAKAMKTDAVGDPALDAQILNALGVVYFRQLKVGRAEQTLKSAVKIGFEPLNNLEVGPGEILNNLGCVYQSTRQYAKAEAAYKRSLALTETRRGVSDPSLAATLVNLGTLYRDVGLYRYGEDAFKRSLSILERTPLSYDELRLIETLLGLGQIYLRQNQPMQAEPVLRRAVEMARRNDRLAGILVKIEVLEVYSRVLRDLSNPVEADRLQAEVQRIRASQAFTVRVKP